MARGSRARAGRCTASARVSALRAERRVRAANARGPPFLFGEVRRNAVSDSICAEVVFSTLRNVAPPLL